MGVDGNNNLERVFPLHQHNEATESGFTWVFFLLLFLLVNHVLSFTTFNPRRNNKKVHWEKIDRI